MKEIVKHVDGLFIGHMMNRNNKELRDEIISNLEAKVSDYVSDGMEEREAIELAIGDLGSIEHLIDGNREIYTYRYTTEVIQVVLLYLLISWAVTIPLLLTPNGAASNVMLFAVSIFVAVVYIIRLREKDQKVVNKTGYIKGDKLRLMGKAVWVIWAVYVTGYTIFNTAMAFGSDIWFSRPLRIEGPYQFAVVATAYIKPFITIYIPIAFNKACGLIGRYEVRD